MLNVHDQNDAKFYAQAQNLADYIHEGQKRKYNGNAYVTHPIRCSKRILELTGSFDLGIVMLLHDGVEDRPERCSFEMISMLYGSYVAECVGGLTNPSKQEPNLSRKERKEMDRFHYMDAPIAVKICKLVDRIDNLGEMSIEQDPGFARIYADESQLLLRALETNKSGMRMAESAFGLFQKLVTELDDCIHSIHLKLDTSKGT